MKTKLNKPWALLFFAAAFFSLARPVWAQEAKTVRVTVDKKSREAFLTKRQDGGFCLTFYGGACWRSLSFEKDAGPAIDKAAQNYLSQFEKHKLKRNKPSSLRAYASLPVRVAWGTTMQKLDRQAPSAADIGYAFSDNSPYFSILVQNAKNQLEQDTPALQESGQALLLFTKSQLQGFLDAIFDR